MSDVEAVDWTMRAEWLELRRVLLFETEPDHFASACEDLRERLGAERESASAARRLQICHLLTELTIDIASYLPRWHLLGRDRKGDAVLSAGVARDRTLIEEQVQANIDLIERWSAPRAAAAREEIGRIDSSNLRRMSEMTDAGTIANRFGNDSPHGVSRAIRRGGILVTTNPVMVNNARKVEASHWREVRDQLNQRYSSAPVAQRAMHFAIEVVLDVARELRPIYLASDGCFGHVTYQVNPHDFRNAEAMTSEAQYVWEQLGTQLDDPNVMFKIPATEAGLTTAAQLAGQAIPVTITASCSVAQHIAFAEKLEGGKANCLITQMNGRLDEPVAEELEEQCVAEATRISRWASTAIVRRSYSLMHRERDLKRSHLLVASLRGPWNVEGAITSGLEPIYISAFPDKAEEYDSTQRQIASHMEEEIPADIINALMKSRRFKEAYDPSGLSPADFERYHTVAKTLSAFQSAYDELLQYLDQ